MLFLSKQMFFWININKETHSCVPPNPTLQSIAYTTPAYPAAITGNGICRITACVSSGMELISSGPVYENNPYQDEICFTLPYLSQYTYFPQKFPLNILGQFTKSPHFHVPVELLKLNMVLIQYVRKDRRWGFYSSVTPGHQKAGDREQQLPCKEGIVTLS